MTENQLKYLNYQEQVRHNAATEADTDEQILANRQKIAQDYELGQANVEEARRANQAREKENWRHNVTTETQTDANTELNSLNSMWNNIFKALDLVMPNVNYSTSQSVGYSHKF